jgi:hypothetical protein
MNDTVRPVISTGESEKSDPLYFVPTERASVRRAPKTFFIREIAFALRTLLIALFTIFFAAARVGELIQLVKIFKG